MTKDGTTIFCVPKTDFAGTGDQNYVKCDLGCTGHQWNLEVQLALVDVFSVCY